LEEQPPPEEPKNSSKRGEMLTRDYKTSLGLTILRVDHSILLMRHQNREMENSEMVQKANSLALSFPFCQFTILHNLVAALIVRIER
jgi:hypothetical protein